MPIHKNLSGSELHYPLGRSSEGGLLLEDNIAFAYQILVGTNNYFNIATTTGSESFTFGNAVDNPDFTFTGTGLLSSGGGHKYAVTSFTGVGSSHDVTGSNHILLVDTSGGSETLNLPTPSMTENQVFLVIDKTNSFGTNNLILNRHASEKIDNTASNKTINDSGARLWVFCDGTDWYTFLDGESQATGGGGASLTVQAKDADFTALADYYYICDTATNAAAITVTLPNAGVTSSGARIGFKARHGASYSVTLDRSAGGNIDGNSSNLVMSTDMSALILICDGTDYWIES